MRVLGLLGLLLWASAWSQSPITRADLAVRLLEMETCWEAHRDSQEARLRATRPLSEGLTAFFSGRFDALARNLTLTCASLRSDTPPTTEMLYAGSLGVRMPRAIEKESLDKGELVLRFQLFEFYKAEKPQTPLQLRWKVLRIGETRPIREGALDNPEPGAAATLLTQAAEGDYEVQFEIVPLHSDAQIPRFARNDRVALLKHSVSFRAERGISNPSTSLSFRAERGISNPSTSLSFRAERGISNPSTSLSFRAERGISNPSTPSAPQVLRQWKQTFSVISQLGARLEALERAAESHDDADTIERMTVLNAQDVLQSAQKGESPETFYPLLRLLQLAERLAAGWEEGKSAWQPAPGDYWMATLHRERKVAFRLFIPKPFKPNQPIPVVVALHGAGGNEHLFFEGYGLGIVLKEAEKRGWAVIAPRAEMSLAHVGGALEAVQKLLPVDPKRIYLMGHSMGGAHSFAAIAQFPDKFRAVVIFAGAGQPTQVPSDLPILMTVGEQELAMLKNNIENAYRRLQGLNLKTLDYKKYDACDHLMIVREAMPDAFAFFDRAPVR